MTNAANIAAIQNDQDQASRSTSRYSPTTPWIGRTEPQLLQLGHCQ